MPKFVPRQRKQKHRRREEENKKPVDTNFTEVPASARNDKESRREHLREELRSQHPKVSSKKQKRLDKYIVCMVPLLWSMLISAGKQTQERREPRTTQETRPSQGRHRCFTKHERHRKGAGARSAETVNIHEGSGRTARQSRSLG